MSPPKNLLFPQKSHRIPIHQTKTPPSPNQPLTVIYQHNHEKEESCSSIFVQSWAPCSPASRLMLMSKFTLEVRISCATSLRKSLISRMSWLSLCSRSLRVDARKAHHPNQMHSKWPTSANCLKSARIERAARFAWLLAKQLLFNSLALPLSLPLPLSLSLSFSLAYCSTINHHLFMVKPLFLWSIYPTLSTIALIHEYHINIPLLHTYPQSVLNLYKR